MRFLDGRREPGLLDARRLLSSTIIDARHTTTHSSIDATHATQPRYDAAVPMEGDRVFRDYKSAALAKGEWRDFGLRFNGATNLKHCAACPATAAAIESVEAAHLMVLGSAYFSFMRPGTLLKAHCGPTNARPRVRLSIL